MSNVWLVRRSVRDALQWQNHWTFEPGSEQRTDAYLTAVVDWVGRAQDAWPGGGVSSRYDLRAGRFLTPYPETTGYLIPSMLDVSRLRGDAALADRCRRAADWLVRRQAADGSIDCGFTDEPAPADKRVVILFDCAAILQGFVAMYRHARADTYATAADRLAQFLVDRQLPGGGWNELLYFPYFGSHNALVGAALIEAGLALDRPAFVEAGTKCLDLIRKNILPNGFISGCHFTADATGTSAFLHPLAYTVEGFVRSSRLLNRDDYRAAVEATLAALLRRFEVGRAMPASHYDEHWRRQTTYSAVDADCQIAMLWFLFSRATGDLRFANSALKMMDLIRDRIAIDAGAPDGVRGGLPGSFPIQGDNQRHTCINWAAKYFIDASLLELEFRRSLES